MLNYEDTLLDEDVEAASRYRRALADRVEQALGEVKSSTPRLLSVTVPVEPVEPLRWLRAQPQTTKAYWAGRCGQTAVAAVGRADTVARRSGPVEYDGLENQLRAKLETADDPSVRYYGGIRFDADQSPARSETAWTKFGTSWFVLPRFELRQTEEATTITCNLVLPCDGKRRTEIQAAIDRMVWPLPDRPRMLSQPVRRFDAPDQEAWMQTIEWALESIEQGEVEKVVFARRSVFDFVEALDPLLMLRHLQAATPGCFHFGLQPAGGTAFLGASPERLFRQEGRAMWSEAVAGTRSRGVSEQADAALRDELLESEKERREHAFVQEAIQQGLDSLCAEVEIDEPTSEMKLARGRHLRSRFKGWLGDGVTSIDVLRALHPTPAVGGVPTEAALRAIRQREPFDRGWYAGPVGWIGPDAAEFAVALRCGLVHGDQLALYSGAGIVEGSMPRQEWEEIEQKISDFAAVMDLNG